MISVVAFLQVPWCIEYLFELCKLVRKYGYYGIKCLLQHLIHEIPFVQVLSWFTQNEVKTGLQVVRIKNKFAAGPEDISDGCYTVNKVCMTLTNNNLVSFPFEHMITGKHEIFELIFPEPILQVS